MPYSGLADVAPAATPPSDTQRVQATPEAFGGGLAAGAQKLGAGALAAGKFFGEVAAGDANNQFMEGSQKVIDDFETLKGRAAMDARPKAEAQIKDLFDSINGNMQTPEQQFYFNEYSRRYRSIVAGRIGSHAAQQTDAWYGQVEAAGVDQGQKLIASADPNSPAYDDTVKTGIAMSMQNALRGVQRRTGEATGVDVDTVMNDTLAKIRAASVKTQVEALRQVDPLRARAVLEQNRDAAGPFYEPLAGQLKTQVDRRTAYGIVDQATAGAAQDLSTPGTLDKLHGAFMQQESGDRGVNPGQVQPATFQQFAQPGEVYGDPAAMRNVAYRALDAYAQRYQGDPQRIAVAYFSGPGNVAPLDSPTPYLRDVADSNGKTVSSYVSDIEGRVGATGFKAGSYQRILDATRDMDPAVRNDAIREFNQRYAAAQIAADQTLAAQKQQRESSADAITKQILGGDPVGANQRILADPYLDHETRENLTRFAQEHARNTAEGAVATNGPGFWDVYKQATAPEDDPARLTDPGQVRRMALPGPNGEPPQLTLSGVKEITDTMAKMKTVEGVGVARMEAGQLAKAKSILSFEQDMGFFKIPDPEGNRIFEGTFIPAFFKAYGDGIKEGKTPYQLLSPDSPDYITDRLIAANKRPDAEQTKALFDAKVQLPAPARKLSDITDDVISGKLTKEQGYAEALKLDFIRPNAPPSPSEPVAPLQ